MPATIKPASQPWWQVSADSIYPAGVPSPDGGLTIAAIERGEPSPRWVVRLVNRTSAPFTVMPTSRGQRDGFGPRTLAPGQGLEVTFNVCAYAVAECQLDGRQVINGPYIDQAGADLAKIRIAGDEVRSPCLSLRHDAWLAGPTSAAPLLLEVDGVRRTPWFGRGPHGR